jgi:hypothetical protein
MRSTIMPTAWLVIVEHIDHKDTEGEAPQGYTGVYQTWSIAVEDAV